jgi:hypothetical protein
MNEHYLFCCFEKQQVAVLLSLASQPGLHQWQLQGAFKVHL